MNRRLKLQQVLEPDAPPSETLEQESLQRLEEEAEQAFRCGQYEIGRNKYLILTDQKPDEAKYWRGLGKAQSGCADWEQARFAFLKGAEIDPMEPAAVLGLFECYRRMGKREAAMSALNVAQAICHCDEKHFNLLDRIEVLRTTF